MADNLLYYGDNLDILRHRIPSASVDLIYLDPPFNSNADYNVIFREQSGQRSAAQIKAFTDTWHWDTETDRAREEILTGAPENVARMLDALVTFIGRTDLTAYLVMMTQRLVELHRVLKPTGSLYLHCDPTASHYLKIVLDSIFGPEYFVNEIVWERTNAHNMRTRGYIRANDVILLYSKADSFVFNVQYTPYGPEQMSRFKPDEQGRLYTGRDLTFSTVTPSRQFEWRGARPPANRSWGASLEQLEQWYAEGRILLKKDGTPRLDGLKIYLDETKGKPVTTNWTDIDRVGNTSSERLGYPTQKPLALLERIISASSNPGDVVMDPFCGCGTAICAAQKLGRRWIGIDITHLAVSLMKSRLKSMFGLDPNTGYEVIGEPKDVAGARQLAQDDRYQFQYWAVSLVEATARDAERQQKKGADKGIDGTIGFIDGANRHRETIVVQVKSGHATAAHIRDLVGVVEREKAALGLYICLEAPTKDMRDEAASAGFYHSALWPGKHGDHRWPRIQIRTIAELLAGQGFAIPPRPVQFKQAERAATAPGMAAPALWDAPSAAGVPVPIPVPVPDVDADEEEDGVLDGDADAADDVP